MSIFKIDWLALFQDMKGISSAKDWRLFSAGLHGLVIEHKLELEFDEDLDDHDSYQHQPRNSWPVTSGAVWCMKFNEVGSSIQWGLEFRMVHSCSVSVPTIRKQNIQNGRFSLDRFTTYSINFFIYKTT